MRAATRFATFQFQQAARDPDFPRFGRNRIPLRALSFANACSRNPSNKWPMPAHMCSRIFRLTPPRHARAHRTCPPRSRKTAPRTLRRAPLNARSLTHWCQLGRFLAAAATYRLPRPVRYGRPGKPPEVSFQLPDGHSCPATPPASDPPYVAR